MKASLKRELLAGNRKRIVLYGAMGGKEKRLETAASPFRFYYMDLEQGSAARENWLDSLEAAEREKVDAFVIRKQMIGSRSVFRQLLEYCRRHGARMYDPEGRRLGDICEEALNRKCVTRRQLEKEIESHDGVSFDIFDTLLTRKVLAPEDVFDLAAERLEASGLRVRNFREKRQKAQSLLGLTNPDIYQIYDKFRKYFKISEETAAACMKAELETEREVLIPRTEMVEMFRECLRAGKRVCLVSDMYLTREQLVPILERCGITGYEELYLSCEKKQLKLQGLLETYKRENPAAGYLHIGDHYIHDGICAALAGMDYCLVQNGGKLAGELVYKEALGAAHTLNERIMLGLAAARLFNSPFAESGKNGRIKVESEYEYGYAFCAPLVSGYMLWLYEEVSRGGYEAVLFASRDGWLAKRLYEMLVQRRGGAEMPEGIYFYTSRKAAVMTGINNEAFINMIIDISPGMPPKKLMRERFGLPASRILEYDTEKYGDSIHKYVWEHAEAIFQRAEEAKQNYYRYMGSIDLKIGRKYAFMDFVSSGTSQKSLARIAPFKLEGLYAGWNGGEEREGLGVKAFFDRQDSYFMKHFKMMETFMTSEEPSVSCFDEKGRPVFASQERTEKDLAYVENMQRACEDFLEDYLRLAGPYAGTVSAEAVSGMFAACEYAEAADKDSVLRNLRLMDDWRRKSNKVKELVQ